MFVYSKMNSGKVQQYGRGTCYLGIVYNQYIITVSFLSVYGQPNGPVPRFLLHSTLSNSS